MKKFTMFIIVAFLSAGLYAGDVLHTYNLKDINGNVIKMEAFDGGIKFPNFKGKAVLLNFFGYFCPPCLAEIPHLVKIEDKFKDKFHIVALQVQKRMGEGELANFVKDHNINYTVIGMDDPKIFDLINFVTVKTGWGGQIPFMILLDKDGNAITTYLGKQSEETLIKDIKSVIK